MSIKKKVIISLGVAVLAIALTTTSVFAAVGTNVLELHGSTTLGPVVVAAAPAFNAAGLGVTIDTAGILQNSSGAGISDLNANQQLADIAMSSRALKSAEAAVDTPTDACVDAVVIMVNDTYTPADITQLTKQQIRGIYEDAYAATPDGPEYWDAGAVTVSSAGLPGDDGLNYDQGVTFPALPGNGNPLDHVQIVVLARNLNSGTRAFLGDTVAHGGCAFAGPQGTDPIASSFPYASYYSVEEQFLGTTDSTRQLTATNMSNAISTATNAAIGYAGVGYDTAPHIRDLKVIDDLSGTDRTAYAATNINIYSYHYHLSRYLYLVTKNGDANHANDMVFVNWFETLDSAGQDAAVASHELRLVPDEDINHDGVVNYLDLGQLGNDYGKTGASHFTRSDVNRDGVVNYLDLGDIGNWYGIQIQTLP